MLLEPPPQHDSSTASSPAVAIQPTDIPRSFTSFIGREREIDRVTALVRDPNVRLVTLTGPGGVGKTRLALEVAQRLRDEVEHIWFVSLVDARSQVPANPAEPGIDQTPTLRPDESIQDLLASHRSLLVFDTFEHVIGAAHQVAALIDTFPPLTVLVTSRIPLNISVEHICPVGPLTLPEAATVAFTDDEPLPEATRLFVDRARSHTAVFTLTTANSADVAHICRSLSGIPLAIELAAARVAMMPPSAISSRLDRQLSLLTGGPKDAPARQRTIRATIAWSYDLLNPSEQALIQRLGIFVDGFTLDAVEAIAGQHIPSVLDAMSSLVASNLIEPVAWEFPSEPRYRMLDTVREFVLEAANDHPDQRQARLAHALYYTALAEDALPLYDGPDLVPATIRVCAELANARAAINWSLEHGDRESGVRLAGALWRLWHTSLANGELVWLDRVAQGRMIVERALSCIEGLPAEAVTELLAGAANLCTVLGDTDSAVRHARELWRRSLIAGYNYGKYWALYSEGQAAYTCRDFTRAITLWEECTLLAPTIRNPENHTVMILLPLSLANSFIGRLPESRAQLARALELARVCGNPTMIGWATILAGQQARARGALKDAFALLRESAEHDMILRKSLVAVARIALALDQTDCAIELLGYSTWSPFPEDQRDLEEGLAEVRRAVGDDGLERIAAARRNPDPARIEMVLDQLEALLESTPVLPVQPGPLSRREREVIVLLSHGKSNRAIAEQLSISERTVENHVAHILTKLDLDSRTAAATWAVRNHLT